MTPLKVVKAVERDLTEIRKRSRSAASSGLAVTALALARALDDPETSATARAACAKELRETMRVLREFLDGAPAKVQPLEEMRQRRATRKAR